MDLSTVPGMHSKTATWSAVVTDNLNPNLEETLVMLVLCSHGTQIVNMTQSKLKWVWLICRKRSSLETQSNVGRREQLRGQPEWN
jgi:hypothetical protein